MYTEVIMTETEHNIAENNEDQTFMQASEQHFNLIGDEFDQQNLVGSVPEEYQCTENEADNQNMTIHDQDFSVNEIENNYGVLPEQTFAENENEHSLDGDEANNGLDGEQLKQESSDNETNELGNDSENTHFEKKDEHENNLAAVSDEKKWPGWPGESVFRMLVPSQKVGNIIGRKGEYIKKIVEETRARIKVMEGPPGSQVRAVSFFDFFFY